MTKNTEKKSMSKMTQPTRTLRYLLELINLVEPNARLFDGKLEYTKSQIDPLNPPPELDFEASVQAIFDEQYAQICEMVEQIRDETKEYPTLVEDISRIFCTIWEIECKPDELSHLINYKDFLRIRREMWYLVAGSEAVKERNRTEIINMHFSSLSFNARPQLTDDGILTFERDIMVSALEGIELNRLRICKICSRIFWAYRSDKFGCSDLCNGNIRTRRLRKRNAERFPSRVRAD